MSLHDHPLHELPHVIATVREHSVSRKLPQFAWAPLSAADDRFSKR